MNYSQIIVHVKCHYNMTPSIPRALKLFVCAVMRMFYSTEDILIMDILVRNICLKEKDIVELMHLDTRTVRKRLSKLRKDMLIKTRSYTVIGDYGLTQKAYYHFISYPSFVNVIKYKLDYIRKRLLEQDREEMEVLEDSFKCSHCPMTFDDFDVDKLFDTEINGFSCPNCSHPVTEIEHIPPEENPVSKIARFNEQVAPLYNIMYEVEKARIPLETLDPSPVDINCLKA